MIELPIVLLKAGLVALQALIPGFAVRLNLPPWVQGRSAIAPLLGICALAWWTQLVYLFGGSAAFSLGTGYCLVLACMIIRRSEIRSAWNEFKSEDLSTYLLFYCMCLLATSMIVWPAAGPWSTDWIVSFQQSEFIWEQRPLTEWALARPSMFASISIPYLTFMNGLDALQVGICAASAAALLAAWWYVQSLSSGSANRWLFVGLFCASPFFLVNLTAFVPKFLQATLIVGSFMAMAHARNSHLIARIILSTAMLAFAMELHHSTVAYAIVFAIGWLVVGRHQPQRLLAGAVTAAFVAALLVGLPESRKIFVYGFEEIAKYNPSKAMRSIEQGWFVFLMTLECKLAGYQYLVPPYMFLKESWLGTRKPLNHYLSWYWFVHLGIMANTFVFIMLPLLFTWNRLKSYCSFVLAKIPFVILMSIPTAIIINGLLNPYYISSGNVHCGSTAVALGLMVTAIAWLSQQPSPLARTSMLVTLAVGFAPWVIWQTVQFALVCSRGGFANSDCVMDDNLDQAGLLSIGQESWGYSQWPILPLTLGIMICLILKAEKTRTREMSAHDDV